MRLEVDDSAYLTFRVNLLINAVNSLICSAAVPDKSL